MGVAERLWELAKDLDDGVGEPVWRTAVRRSDKTMALRTLQRFGMQPYEDPNGEHAWDGARLNYWLCDVADLYHELAHFQVAQPSHRARPEYALGNSSVSPGTERPRALGYHACALYEAQASLLGILWMRHKGLYWCGTLRDHNWDSPLAIYRMLKSLYTAGFIDVTGKPLFVVR